MAGKAGQGRFEKNGKKGSRRKAAIAVAGTAALAAGGLALEHGATAPTPLNAVLSANATQANNASNNAKPPSKPKPPKPPSKPGHASAGKPKPPSHPKHP